jgi:SAM-dependent methyltransferase
MPTPAADIANLYNILGAGEVSRLDTHPVERLVTLRTISEALPPAPQRIADVGGGPGTYAFALADQGHSVDLVDLSPRLIQLAQVEQVQREGSGNTRLLQSLSVGNALDPTILQHGIYDAVLLLGPLYHLVEESERVEAVANAVRLAKPNGVLFVAFVSIAAHLRDIAMREPGRLITDKEFYAKYVCSCPPHLLSSPS